MLAAAALITLVSFTLFFVAGEIVAHVTSSCWGSLKSAPERLAMPDFPEATSPSLTENYHVRAEHIAARVGKIIGKEVSATDIAQQRKHPHDVPGEWFTGPF